MKKLLIPVLGLLGCSGAFAQTAAADASASPAADASATPPSVASPAPSAPAFHPGRTPLISPEENQKLRAANMKAKEDPAVVAARQKIMDSMKAAREAIIAKDPSMTPIFDKLQPSTPPAPGAPRPQLTAEEQGKLVTARQSMKGTPEEAAVMSAQTEYSDALDKAMIAADPSVEPIVNKIKAARAMMQHPPRPAVQPPAAAPSASGS